MSELQLDTVDTRDSSTIALDPKQPPVAICVPVRDEHERLPDLIDALIRQVEAGDCRICLVFDGAEPVLQRRIEQSAGQAGMRLVCRTITRLAQPNAGRARRAAMTLGLEVLADRDDALILTTDADTIPEPDWVAQSRSALTGADIVAGHIRREAYPIRPARDRLERYLDRLYQLERSIDPIDDEPSPGYPSLGGASLGFRADVYRRLGGFKAYPSGEDVSLVDAARRRGYRLRRDPRVRVTTASRLVGRAIGGLADELSRQHIDAAGIRVAHPADIYRRVRRAARARQAFGSLDQAATKRLAAELDLSHARLEKAIAAAPSADALVLRILASDPAPREIALDTAELELNSLLRIHSFEEHT